jgi:hypothetical protein
MYVIMEAMVYSEITTGFSQVDSSSDFALEKSWEPDCTKTKNMDCGPRLHGRMPCSYSKICGQGYFNRENTNSIVLNDIIWII